MSQLGSSKERLCSCQAERNKAGSGLKGVECGEGGREGACGDCMGFLERCRLLIDVEVVEEKQPPTHLTSKLRLGAPGDPFSTSDRFTNTQPAALVMHSEHIRNPSTGLRHYEGFQNKVKHTVFHGLSSPL